MRARFLRLLVGKPQSEKALVSHAKARLAPRGWWILVERIAVAHHQPRTRGGSMTIVRTGRAALSKPTALAGRLPSTRIEIVRP